MFLQRRRLGRRKDAIEPPQDGERQDDLAILISLVGAAEQIANAPNEAGDLRVGFRSRGCQLVEMTGKFMDVSTRTTEALLQGVDGHVLFR